MLRITPLCTDCAQVITNPLCPSCSAEGIIAWARDRGIKSSEMNEIKKLLKELVVKAEETPSSIDCIRCSSIRVNLCGYCFTNRTERIIAKSTKNEKLIEDFNEDFDTKIWTLKY